MHVIDDDDHTTIVEFYDVLNALFYSDKKYLLETINSFCRTVWQKFGIDT